MEKQDCEAANIAVFGKDKANKKKLMVGDDEEDEWSWVPPGCSTQTLDDGADKAGEDNDLYRAVWNAHVKGENDGNYQRLCTKGTRRAACSGGDTSAMLLRVCAASLSDLCTRVRPS